MSKGLKAFWWFLTGAVAIVYGIFELASQPEWWATAIAIVAAAATIIFGKPWQPPVPPE